MSTDPTKRTEPPPEIAYAQNSKQHNSKAIWFVVIAVAGILGLCLCVTILGVAWLFNPDSRIISLGSPKPTHYGVYFKQGGALVEIPVSNRPFSGTLIETSDTRPTLVFWQGNVNLDLLRWQGDPNGIGRLESRVLYTATPIGSGILELTPNQTLKGNYCLTQGNILARPGEIPYWCFGVKLGADTSTAPTQVSLATSVYQTTPINAATPTLQLSTGTPADAGTWKLVPIAIQASNPSDGWVNYEVTLALENQGTQIASPNLKGGAGIIETREGYTYTTGLQDIRLVYWSKNLPIPPKFRIRGYSSPLGYQTFYFQFSVAQGMHPVRAKFPTYGDIELTGVKTLSFPTDQPRSLFRNMGETIEIPNKARITFKEARSSQYTVFVDIQLQNLNVAYETDVTAVCVLFDGTGNIRTEDTLGSTPFRVGPSQTVLVRKKYILNATWDDIRNIQTALTNAKLVCTGDFETIINIDFKSIEVPPLPSPTR